jgi:DNA (cytosine-5)-methyltransferase 1
MINSHGFSAVDLFCGAGGLTYGLLTAGIPVKAGVDVDARCRYAYETNNDAAFVKKDVATLSSGLVRELFDDVEKKILVGCAPCQPFSSHTQKMKNRDTDSQRNLLYSFCRLVRSIEPEIVSLENVPNLVKYAPFENLLSILNRMEYFTTYSTVDCERFGVPQLRKRLVLLASKLGPISLPAPTHPPDKLASVRKAIEHLDKLDHGNASKKDPLHRAAKLSALNLKRISSSKPGGSWHDWNEEMRSPCHSRTSGRSYTSSYGRMEWDKPAPTITTQFYNYGSGRFGHPEQNRALTLREGAILQTFPERYEFVDPSRQSSINMKEIGMFIGNAVPVKLGETIGLAIQENIGA